MARDLGSIEGVVDQCDARREEDSCDLVELYAGVGERGVGEDDVRDHGQGEWKDGENRYSFGGEDADSRAGDGVEEEGRDGKVEGGECHLGVTEGRVGEDAFVGEYL
jgi:hypothetical protein